MSRFKSHPTFTMTEDIKAICDPLKSLGIKYFAHTVVNQQGDFSGIGTDPAFAKFYLENQLYNVDVHMIQSIQDDCYLLEDAHEFNPDAQVVNDYFIELGYGHTLSVIQIDKCSGIKQCYHFAGQNGDKSINNRYLTHLPMLKQFAQYFKDAVFRDSRLKLAYEQTYKLNHGAVYENDKKVLKIPKPERWYINNSEYLTQREFESLYWLSQGKSFVEIATILHISHRTVKAHITHAKEKLGCDSLFQLGVRFSSLIVQ